MTKSWFRKNHQSVSPARLAEAQNLVARQDAYDRAKEATVHLLTALKQWPGFDSTGNINGAIDHTLVNIDRLDDALDELRDQIDKLRGMQIAEMVQRSGHPSTLTVPVGSDINVLDAPTGVMRASRFPLPSALPDAATQRIVVPPKRKSIIDDPQTSDQQ
ncbi:hypothetical protein [Glutamicibacter sp. Je.9.36]|uniref:hypothetical protein n=1 Tax=Glutamicibacter sp. Je.9.36 TaxID=3142837 RepID=UPI003DA863FC